VSLPDPISVRYTEEEAEYLSVRPVVRQTFRLVELVDMVLGVTGKDLPRIRQILHSGTIVFNFYRYWWQGFDADAQELAAVLENFPDSDASRAFCADECSVVLLAGRSYQPAPGHLLPPANAIELPREETARRRVFRRKSLWDALMTCACEPATRYLGYSYLRHADVYAAELAPEQAASLARDAETLAPRSLRARLAQIAAATRILFLCPRKT
jgi:hypothetical protein